ncbi:MAG: hypothetical protein JWN88_268 [Frankiales bacterium]|nr:hypothetical protein [Frankiales bacterium]
MRRLLVVLLVLFALVAFADRVGAVVAGRAVAAQLQSSGSLSVRPEVEVRGIPFLTQAVAGRYEDVRVRATDVPVGETTVRELTAMLSGVRAPLEQAISGSLPEVRVDQVQAQALLSYEALSLRSGERALTLSAEGERVRVRGSVRVGGVSLEAEALSAVELRGDVLVVTAQELKVGDERVDRAIERALQGRLDLRVPVSGLPYGLRLTDVRIDPDGIRLQASARDTVLSAP